MFSLHAAEAQAAKSGSPDVNASEHTALTIDIPATVCGKWLDLDEVSVWHSLDPLLAVANVVPWLSNLVIIQ